MYKIIDICLHTLLQFYLFVGRVALHCVALRIVKSLVTKIKRPVGKVEELVHFLVQLVVVFDDGGSQIPELLLPSPPALFPPVVVLREKVWPR